MSRIYSLAHLTTLDLSPPAMITAAAQAGYDACGLRLLPFAPGGAAYLMEDPALLTQTLAVMRDTGLRIQDIEIIRLRGPFDAAPYRRFFEIGQRLGARNILVTGEDPDAGRLVDSFAQVCEAARPFGLSVDVEFMPWMAVNCVAAARRLVEAAAQPNGGLLIDPIHFARSPSSVTELADLPRALLHYVQICDAPAEAPRDTDALIDASRHARLAPGDGDLPLAQIYASLPDDIPVSVEIPNVALRAKLGTQTWIRRCLERSKPFCTPHQP